MTNDKIHFFQHGYIPLLQKLLPDQKPIWGKMDGQQMVEHMRDVFKLANGKIVLPLMDPDPGSLVKKRAFIMSDKEFAPNTAFSLMPEEPRKHKYGNLAEAIGRMKEEMDAVFAAYDANPSLILIHPVFGELDYEMQVIYLLKHARHHLRQFGLVD